MADFTAVGDTTAPLIMSIGESSSWAVSGTFTGSVVLEVTKHPLTGPWKVVGTISTETSATFTHEDTSSGFYRLRCTAIGEAETITALLAEATGQISQTFTDNEGVVRLAITDQGATVTGTLNASVSGALAGTHTGNASLAATVFTPVEQTANGVISSSASFVALNKASAGLVMTLAPTAGRILTITQTDAGTHGHTVTLGPGTYDGTNTIATFNAAGETLVLLGISSTRFVILGNFGSVALS